MKNLTSIYLSLILSVSLISHAEAAKENFDRSKPTAQAANGLDNDCNGAKNKPACKPQQLSSKPSQLTNKPTCQPSNSAHCPKPFGHVTVLKAQEGHVTVLKAKEGHVTVLKANDGHVTVLKAKATAPQIKPINKAAQATDYNSSRSNKADN